MLLDKNKYNEEGYIGEESEDLKKIGEIMSANYKKMLVERNVNPNVIDAERELSILLYENISKELDQERIKELKRK